MCFLWVSNVLATFFENRIKAIPDLTPSVQELFAKLFKITVMFIAVVAAISAVGIDLTAFAVIGGAVGVGIGLGLQKIVANLISGIILLMDKSIKPGDVIAVADYYGRVDSLGGALRVGDHARRYRALDPERRPDRQPCRELVTQQQPLSHSPADRRAL